MTTFSACIEMLFLPETDDFAQRIHLAKAEGFDLVEFWLWSNKDLEAVERALAQTGVKLAGIVAEPFAELTREGDHDRFLAGLERSRDVALRLGAPILICQSGPLLAGVDRARQHDTLTIAMSRSADVLKGSGVRLALEPLNDRVDHPGYYLTSTAEGLDIADAVNRPEIGITYDLYHSMVMGEDPEQVVADRLNRVFHVHIADHPGRNEPGSGGLPLKQKLGWLVEQGYDGAVGLEFRPTGSTAEALRVMRRSLDA
ncbi:TIM barrel protein [Devosia psychrophila]|uniref:Hydroxypyruvate isomerase n=1 Tax=Devosia psychrophila TaxID=728005 RepID=A0A0F5PSI6_9HYPH|nr:TIM barrel protein [Devosia psychrophila]KKC31603.1 hydroxypyruvate isomerase [Devosia psychrophila]SFB96130.1 hydroxypyruvate isomerase [Devosia psychrophila]